MTSLFLAIASMLALGLMAWLAAKVSSRVPVCPVCVGIAGTWLWMLAARLAGYAVDTVLLGILMGASVVGFAQAIDARLPAGRSPLAWKALALPAGIVAAAGAAGEHWWLAGAAGGALAFLTAIVLRRRDAKRSDSAVVSQLEERMKKCC